MTTTAQSTDTEPSQLARMGAPARDGGDRHRRRQRHRPGHRHPRRPAGTDGSGLGYQPGWCPAHRRAAGGVSSSIAPFVADVADGATVQSAMQATTEQLGAPTLLVNNAGPTAIGTNLDFGQAVDAALGSVQKVTEAFLAANPGPGASVVNISAVSGSVTGGTGNDPPGFGWYAAAKAGILGYTRWCATEIATSCRFNAIAPGGPIETPRNRAFLDSPGMVERIRRNPMRRPGTATELAAGILFSGLPPPVTSTGSAHHRRRPHAHRRLTRCLSRPGRGAPRARAAPTRTGDRTVTDADAKSERPADLSDAELEELFERCSNRGRWGDDDRARHAEPDRRGGAPSRCGPGPRGRGTLARQAHAGGRQHDRAASGGGPTAGAARRPHGDRCRSSDLARLAANPHRHPWPRLLQGTRLQRRASQ